MVLNIGYNMTIDCQLYNHIIQFFIIKSCNFFYNYVIVKCHLVHNVKHLDNFLLSQSGQQNDNKNWASSNTNCSLKHITGPFFQLWTILTFMGLYARFQLFWAVLITYNLSFNTNFIGKLQKYTILKNLRIIVLLFFQLSFRIHSYILKFYQILNTLHYIPKIPLICNSSSSHSSTSLGTLHYVSVVMSETIQARHT